MKKLIPFVVAPLFISSCCILPADDVLVVKGEAPENMQCTLALEDSDGPLNYRDRKIKGNFKETFVVSACSDDHFVKVVCENKTILRVKVRKRDATIKEPYNFGVITP